MSETTSKTMPVSSLWERVNKSLGDPYAIDLATFKSQSPNFNISLWNPHANGVRYLKTLLYNLVQSSDDNDFALYAKIKNRGVGSPLTVRVRGEDVCMDYFQAVDEAKTVLSCLSLEAARIVEIGSGYGRTCHTLLSLVPDIGSYCLVDLEPCLILSKRYLEAVLPSDMLSKIKYVSTDEFIALSGPFELAINIDSFADMLAPTVEAYIKFIDAHCGAFYCKNPLGKYQDVLLDGKPVESEAVRQAMQAGIIRDVIDIFDSQQISKQKSRFLELYCPGQSWKVAAERTARPWSFYHQALFAQSQTSR